MKVRVFYRPDGTIAVLYPIEKARHEHESWNQFLNRLTEKCPYKNLPFDDIEDVQLPMRVDPGGKPLRHKWRGAKGKGIWIDDSIVTKSEKIKEKEITLNQELDGTSPDTVKILKLMREIKQLGIKP